MIELTDLPDGALEDMKRYVSYAWPPGRIAQLLNRAYDLNLTRRDRHRHAPPVEARM